LEHGTGDPEKAEAAAVFYAFWKRAEAVDSYAQMKQQWKREKG
jgi:hypothetical protein